jgi:hypothetical protein
MMKIPFKPSIYLLLISLGSFTFTAAQNGVVEVHQDKQIDALLRMKKEVDAKAANYKIQIYSGNRAGAEKAQTAFRNAFGEWPSTKEFETPNYKIWVGNFKTRLEADRALVKIKRKFANAFYFRPKQK